MYDFNARDFADALSFRYNRKFNLLLCSSLCSVLELYFEKFFVYEDYDDFYKELSSGQRCCNISTNFTVTQ